MPLQFFTISARYGQEAAEEMNRFLANNRVLSVERQWVVDGGNSYWAFCVDYLPAGSEPSPNAKSPPSRKPTVDYREVLSPEDFEVFSALRELRKQIAGKSGVPVYVIFSNEQLAQMVQRRVTTKAGLEEIIGAGDAKVSKYGEPFLEALKQHVPQDSDAGESGGHPEPSTQDI